MLDPRWFDGFLTGVSFAAAWGGAGLLYVWSRRHKRRIAELSAFSTRTRAGWPPVDVSRFPPPPPAPKWYEFKPDVETLEQCRDRRLLTAPLIDAAEREVLRQLREVTCDGNLASKSGRDSLIKRGLAVRCNGWQIASREGLALLETLGELRGYDMPPSHRRKS